MDPASIAPRRPHLTRMMSIWRSAGWPCHDPIELDLVAAGWARIDATASGRYTLQLTEAGIRVLAESRQRNRRALGPHDRLADRIANNLVTHGRVVWRELSLRSLAAPGPDAASSPPPLPPKSLWRIARPDVFSVRHTSVEAYLQPMVHEVKVSRADLLSDLRHAAKRQSYRWLSCETYFVFPKEIAELSEIPEDFGVWLLDGPIDSGTLTLARVARHTPCTLPFPVWMALAKSTPLNPLDAESAQLELSSDGAQQREMG